MITLQTASQLAEAGNTAKVISAENSTLDVEARKKGIKAAALFCNNVKTPLSILKLRKEILGFNPDIIHTHLSHDLWAIVPAMKLTSSNAKLFLTKHMAGGVKKNDFFHRFLYNRVNGIFSVSRYVNESVENTCPVPKDKLHILPNGIEIEKFNPGMFDKNKVREKYNIPNDKLIISIIGRMTPGKGHEEFLEAASKINENYGNNVFFVIAGSASKGEDEYEQKIRNKAAELNLQNLVFTGYVKDIREILSVTGILAFPSHNESFGVTLTESMAMNVPVAASSFGGVLDIVEDEVNGLLYQRKDSSQLTNVLIRLINDPELRQKLGKAGRKTVEEKFDINIITKKLMEHYQNG